MAGTTWTIAIAKIYNYKKSFDIRLADSTGSDGPIFCEDTEVFSAVLIGTDTVELRKVAVNAIDKYVTFELEHVKNGKEGVICEPGTLR